MFSFFSINFATEYEDEWRMKITEVIKKVFSLGLWANLLAMAVVVVLLCLGVKYGIDLYTHHGEKIVVPNLRQKSYADAEHILDKLRLHLGAIAHARPSGQIGTNRLCRGQCKQHTDSHYSRRDRQQQLS